MNELVPLLFFFQVLGSFVGACMAIWSEFAYVRAMRDGKIDHAERVHLHILGRGLRFGMVLLLLASLGLVIAAYVLKDVVQPALSAGYWITIVLALVIICATWALSRRKISFSFGSAIVFTAWWFLAYLSIGLLPTLSFGAAVAFLVIATAIFYALLYYGRFLALRK